MGDLDPPDPGGNSAGNVRITARTLGGRELGPHELLANDQVHQLRQRMAAELKVPAFTLKLIFQGQTLDERATFHSLGMSGAVDLTLVKVPSENLDDYRKLLSDFANAVERNNLEEARDLLDQGAGHDSKGNLLEQKGSNVLHLSVRGCLMDLVKYLIEMGANLEAKNEMSRTPLIQASIKNHPEIVEALLRARACVNHRDRSDRTALYYALAKDNMKIAAMLTDAGTDPDEIAKLSYMFDEVEQRAVSLWITWISIGLRIHET